MLELLWILTAAIELLRPTPKFDAAQQTVLNWQAEAQSNLAMNPFRDGEFPTTGVPRCVRLNNYWCIKGGGWAGMIDADAEGHVAFASAADGARAAALLLRRYYLQWGRKSARAVVSRWAPSRCQTGPRLTSGKMTTDAPILQLTTRGLKQTLRARYLAHRGGRGAVKLRRSVVPDLPLLARPMPALMPGARAQPIVENLASLSAEHSMRNVPCEAEAQRLSNYASRMIENVASSSDQDLKLFTSDGVATASFERVLFNMASVEVGPLAPSPAIVKVALSQSWGSRTSLAISRMVPLAQLWAPGLTAVSQWIDKYRNN